MFATWEPECEWYVVPYTVFGSFGGMCPKGELTAGCQASAIAPPVWGTGCRNYLSKLSVRSLGLKEAEYDGWPNRY